MPETIIIKPSIAAQFQRFLQQERVLFFSAPCGFGNGIFRCTRYNCGTCHAQ